ncbi:EAL domain-containing protein [Chitinibacter bivalviorum]|uniref:EAL domain-containing protein n=1 Tax=Chitinibacter bivalviorum TaxID=2739434 RepID=A0A7H9BG77_9NEIS|nr:EAL domain-containing protein [Chitinibacter bivalviorum]QLG87432.1 EAL domain-containing protein [Chitinibacter bivalviorum]
MIWLLVGLTAFCLVLLAYAFHARRLRDRYQALLDSVPDLAWVKDAQGRFVVVNQAFRDIWQIKDPHELLGKDDFYLSPPNLAAEYQADDLKVIRTGVAIRSENPFDHAIDGQRWMELIKVPVYEGKTIIGTAGIARDISERKQAQEQLEWLAWHDPLTQLLNRSYLERQLSIWIDSGLSFSLWLIDLDHFKRINDALGHGAGDAALLQVAKRLQTLSDQVFRLGGDEFVVLAPLQDIERIDDLLHTILNQTIQIEDLDFQLGFTAGRVQFPEDGQTASQLLKHADIALYRGKSAGRGVVSVFASAMAKHAVLQLELERELRQALLLNEFRLVYQPQIRLADNRLIGYEALIRWNQAQRGEVSPVDFIPFAEQTGIIASIGDWALDEAIRQLESWAQAGLAVVPIAVNVSALQLANLGFADSVIARIKRLPVFLQCLIQLELTESTLMQAPSIQSIRQLTQADIAVHMDDFGTGYSNLAMLSRMSLSKLKFDRSLIQNIPDNHAHQQVCRALLDLAHALQLEVVAEGVETQAEALWLAEQGVQYAQGYWFSRPLEKELAARYMDGVTE